MSIDFCLPETTASLDFSDIKLLELSRPTYRVKFVRHGDEVHLLVFLSKHHEIPFLRTSIETLYQASQEFIKSNDIQELH